MNYKKMCLVPMIILLLSFNSISASASTRLPYHTYSYDYWKYVYYTPAAYVPSGNLSGAKMGVGSLTSPQDMFVASDGRIYIADTGNNRIIVLDNSKRVERIIESFDNEGSTDFFKTPSGVHVTEENVIYIADTDNLRIIALNEEGSVIRTIQNPTSEVLDSKFVFSPLKVTVDYADRVYVIAKNMFQGIMTFDDKDNFTGFSGTIPVAVTSYQKFWRRLSTKAQRQRQAQFIPTEFTGVDIAPDGFVYATNIDPQATQSIRRLNPKGDDVIKMNTNNSDRTGRLSGDLFWRLGSEHGGVSRIVDVVYRGNGIYSIIDMTRGRIFTYDHEGNLLYIFGGKGSQEGTFRNPVAIEAKGDEILVLDSSRAEIMSFIPTRYGSLINEAVSLRYDGDEASAVELWKQVLKLDSNFELAYVGIGKAYLAAGDNKEAMHYLKLGMNREYYSIAFKRYRDDILKENLGLVLTGGMILLAVFVISKAYKRINRKGVRTDE